MVAREGPASDAGSKPRHQRPELPEFWDHRFKNGVTPWDAGRVPEQFRQFVERLDASTDTGRQRRALVPGCGTGYEAGHLDARGWDATGLDFSAAAIDAARNALPDFRGRLLCADFFAFEPGETFDLIYERAFLCALPRPFWPDYAPRVADLLAPGAYLAGYFFIDEQALKGPPFGISAALLENFCKPRFTLIENLPVHDSIGPFIDRERWMVWQRN